MAKSKDRSFKHTGIIRGVITALIFSILAVLLYAVILKAFSMGDSTIPYFNQVVKIAGIIIAAYYSGCKERKFFLGSIGGVIFVLITYLMFSGVSGTLGSFSILASDVIMGAVIGGVFAFIALKFTEQKEK